MLTQVLRRIFWPDLCSYQRFSLSYDEAGSHIFMKPDNFAITHFCWCDFADGCRPHDSRQQPCAIMRCDPIWRFSRQPFRFSASKTRIAIGRASPCSNRCASTPKAGARVAAMAVSRVKPGTSPSASSGTSANPRPSVSGSVQRRSHRAIFSGTVGSKRAGYQTTFATSKNGARLDRAWPRAAASFDATSARLRRRRGRPNRPRKRGPRASERRFDNVPP